MSRGGWQVVLVGMMAMAGVADSRQVTQTLAVSATVVPSATVGFEVVAQPLQITDADLDRGYVEVVMKSRMRVSTGRSHETRPAIVMAIEPRADLFKSLAVTSNGNGHTGNGNGHSANGNGHSGNGNGHASLPVMHAIAAAEAASGETAEFRYRFEFSKNARQGQFDTAISVSVDL